MYYVYTRTYAGPNPQENLNVDTVHISTVPVLTNSSKEVITVGWAGTTNDWNVTAYGEYASLAEAKAYVEREFETREIPCEQEYQGIEGDAEVRLLGKYELMSDDELGDWIGPALHEIKANTTDEEIERLVKAWLDECQDEHSTTFCATRAVGYCEERRQDLLNEQEND